MPSNVLSRSRRPPQPPRVPFYHLCRSGSSLPLCARSGPRTGNLGGLVRSQYLSVWLYNRHRLRSSHEARSCRSREIIDMYTSASVMLRLQSPAAETSVAGQDGDESYIHSIAFYTPPKIGMKGRRTCITDITCALSASISAIRCQP